MKLEKVIAIGALGGSGTRVVAQILKNSGIYIGDNINHPNDNLIFTALFKAPKWYKKASRKDIDKRLRIFDKCMNNKRLTIPESFLLLRSSLFNKTIGRNYTYYYKLFFRKINPKISLNYWGWKEPNTQLYLDEINEFYPNIKYIHVLRNGLDMSYSKNKNQLKNWGFKYKIQIKESDSKEKINVKQLDYWIASTKEILRKREKFKNRFYLLNFSEFCSDPNEEIDKLLEFLDLDIEKKKRHSLAQLVKIPKTSNRYRKNKINIFRKDQLEYVEDLGFNVN